MASHRVLIFTTPTCPLCSRATNYLPGRGVTFREIDVSGTEIRLDGTDHLIIDAADLLAVLRAQPVAA